MVNIWLVDRQAAVTRIDNHIQISLSWAVMGWADVRAGMRWLACILKLEDTADHLSSSLDHSFFFPNDSQQGHIFFTN